MNSSALDILRRVFGYPAFRGDQAEVVDHLVGGGDALVLMPTGGKFYYVVKSVERRPVDMPAVDEIFRQPSKTGC